MFVIVGEQIIDPNKEKILIVFSPGDVKNINIMDRDGENCYAICPRGTDKGEINRWMGRKVKELEHKLEGMH